MKKLIFEILFISMLLYISLGIFLSLLYIIYYYSNYNMIYLVTCILFIISNTFNIYLVRKQFREY